MSVTQLQASVYWLQVSRPHYCIKKASDKIEDLYGNGVSEEVRTLDIYLGKVVLYQLSYTHFLEKGG